MATESFGVSFGNPSKYMGSSPVGDIWKGLKTGASIYAMKATGLTDYLDKLGVKQKNKAFSFGNDAVSAPASVPASAPVPDGSAAPPAAMAPEPQPVPPAPAAAPPVPVAKDQNTYYGNSPASGFQAPQTSGFTTPEAAPVPTPRLQGVDILTGKQISVANPNDFDPRENYGYTEQLASGSEYTQQPGYGKTKKLMSSLFGMA
jgi:hypothetical protein